MATKKFNWDELMDGEPHVVDLDQVWFNGGVNELRAMAYREASRRRCTVKTNKLSATLLQIQAHGVRAATTCTCGAPIGYKHRDNCAWLRSQYDQDAANFHAAVKAFIPPEPAPQEQPPTMTVEAEAAQLTEADLEALLGPCSCGQSPTCAPTCSRF